MVEPLLPGHGLLLSPLSSARSVWDGLEVGWIPSERTIFPSVPLVFLIIKPGAQFSYPCTLSHFLRPCETVRLLRQHFAFLLGFTVQLSGRQGRRKTEVMTMIKPFPKSLACAMMIKMMISSRHHLCHVQGGSFSANYV